jgi:hypothetical protein
MNDFNKDFQSIKVFGDRDKRFQKFEKTVKGSMIILLGGWFLFVVALFYVVGHFITKYW